MRRERQRPTDDQLEYWLISTLATAYILKVMDPRLRAEKYSDLSQRELFYFLKRMMRRPDSFAEISE